MDDIKTKTANSVYKTIIATLERGQYKFQKEEDNRKVFFQIETNTLPVTFAVSVDAERQLIRIISGSSVVFPQDKRLDGAVAVCMINCGFVDGGFDYDYSTGMTVFRISTSFSGSVISSDVFNYVFRRAYSACVRYSNQLNKLAQGEMCLDYFLDIIEEM